MTGDSVQVEKKEDGTADDLDISIDFGEPDSSPAEDPTEWFAKMQKLITEDDVTIARGARASVQDDLDTIAYLDRDSFHR